MSEPSKNSFDLLVDQIRAAVREEMQAASASQQQKLLFNTKEAAAMLNIEETWLAAKARAGKIPHRMLGHYRYFSQADIDFIIASARVPVVHSGYDGQGVQENAQGTRDESIAIGEGVGGDGDKRCAVGERGAADIGAGGAGNETSTEKIGGQNVGPQNGGGQLGSTVQGRGQAKAENLSQLPGGGLVRRKDQNPIARRRLRPAVRGDGEGDR
jgi:hypothetical protein